MAAKGKKRVMYVDYAGNTFSALKSWKQKNPGAIYFDSKLERDAYLLLKNSGLRFKFHPETRELVKSFKTPTLSKTKPPKIRMGTVRNISYTPDFLIIAGKDKFFIETKGFFYPADRIRYKLFQNSLEAAENIFLVKNMGQLKWLINYIKQNYD